jgi:SnoaL-like protein
MLGSNTRKKIESPLHNRVPVQFTGKLKNGQPSDMWLRATSGLRKMNGKWLIVHDHVSVPVDFETGKAALGLKP